MKFQLTDKDPGKKPLPEWIGSLEKIKQADDGISAMDLAEYLGTSRDNMRKVLKGILEPEAFRTVGKQLQAFYSTEDLRRLGSIYNQGYRWRK